VAEFVSHDPILSEFCAEVHRLQEFTERVETIIPIVCVGPLELCSSKLKLGLNVEIKAWVTLYCKHLQELYRSKMEEIFEFTDKQVRISLVSSIKYCLGCLQARLLL